MKSHLSLILGLALAASSYAMDPPTLGITRVLDAPGADSQEMVLKHLDSEETLHVDRNIALHDRDFLKMEVINGQDGGAAILITMTEEGKKKLAELTREMVGKRLAITADQSVIMAPMVQEPIPNGVLQISGNLTREKSEGLVRRFNKARKG